MNFEYLLKAQPKDLEELAKRYAFVARDYAHGYVPTNEHKLTGQHEGFRFTMVDPRQKIARLKFELTTTDRGEAVRVIPSLNSDDGVPAYFLPYDNRGAAVELTIPDLKPELPEEKHPKLFFTAVLSGCTIFFKGSAVNPTIYHCGTAGTAGGGTPTTGDSNEFFRHLLEIASSGGLGRPDPIAGMVRKQDYMIPKDGSPGNAELYEQLLADDVRKHFAGRMIFQSLSVWGSVFGIRNGRDWTFYLQENATITFKPIEDVLQEIEVRKKRLIGHKKVTKQVIVRRPAQRAKAVARPIMVQQVFPGVGVATMTDSWKAILR